MPFREYEGNLTRPTSTSTSWYNGGGYSRSTWSASTSMNETFTGAARSAAVTTNASWTTILDLTGEGYLTMVFFTASTSTTVTVQITIDGSVYWSGSPVFDSNDRCHSLLGYVSIRTYDHLTSWRGFKAWETPIRFNEDCKIEMKENGSASAYGFYRYYLTDSSVGLMRN